jgi:peptide/nickel transport system substrate-binding protein
MTAQRFTRRQALRRVGALGLGLPMVAAVLAACSAPAAAPTSAPPAAAKPTTAPAAAPTAVPQGQATTAPAAPTAAPKPTTAPAAAAPTPTAAAAAAGQASTKPKIIVGIVQEPTSLDPTADATASIATTLLDNLYQGLVRLDGAGKVLPSLAKSWDVSPDGTVITFNLNSGIKWHDGAPFTAQDVKFSYERAASADTKPPNPHKDYWAPVSKVDSVDDNTVKVTLSSYSDNWLFHMAAGSACIVSSKSADSNKTNPVGTGPFKFGAWNRGASLSLKRNDEYWGTKAKLTDVEFRFISDADAMNNALKAGDIDAIGQVQGPEQIKQFEADKNFSVIKGAAAGKLQVSMNNTSGPLADKKVRQALYAAIDRKAWIDGIGAGYGEPIGSHATPNDGEPYYADMTRVNTFDVAKAKQLLAEAGQSGLKLRLAQISAFPYAVRGTDILTSQFAAIGVSLDVQPMEFPRWLQEVFLNKQDYDLTIINHVEERDIGNYGNPKYYWHYDNAQVAGWLKEADAQPDAAKRKDLYTKIQQQLADDAANLWIYAPNQLAVLKANLKGYQIQGISPSLYLGDAYFA